MSAEPGVAICTACGVCAPASRPACGVCGLAFPTPRAAAPPPGGDRMWAAVRAGFTCRGCGFLAPLDHLPTDGAVECASCGLRQVFDTTPLGPALAHAHAAADLAGPRPEGRVRHPRVWIGSDNPFHDVGVDRALAPCAGLDPMQLEAGPGYPVCGKCKVPLGVQAQGGVVVTQCPRCGEGARYLLPEGAQALAPGLVGIVSPDHSDRPRARESAGAGGVVALMCPSCGAPLQATPGERM
ncbi:MAG TPA: hypothetical protein VHB21_15305, partial [Minicystis sp.]|nr:hypothetical protein [Minicystis sp.]